MLLFIIFALFIISLANFYEPPSFNEEKNSTKGLKNIPQTAGSDGIIAINNNSDLEKVTSSGNGNKTNPYIIQSKIIDENGSIYCILINNTNKHFELRGCTVYNSTYGIFINNVSNGVILVNSAQFNFNAGMYLKDSNNVTILSNFILNNENNGIIFEQCNFTKILGNSIQYNNNSGIFLNNSNHNNITFNTIDNHKCAIILQSSNYSLVENNKGTSNINGIIEINCIGNLLNDNSFLKSSGSRDDSSRSKEDKIFVDFTIILFLLLGVSFLMLPIVRKLPLFQKQ